MIAALPLFLQGIAMTVDEFYFHRKRGLGTWERVGHPIDTLVFGICAAIAWAVSKSGRVEEARLPFLIIAMISCAVITKDEPLHLKLCCAGEAWLHSALFVLHPICLYVMWRFAQSRDSFASLVVLVATAALFAYQTLYWNFLYDPLQARQ